MISVSQCLLHWCWLCQSVQCLPSSSRPSSDDSLVVWCLKVWLRLMITVMTSVLYTRHPRMLGWSVLGVNYNKRRVKTIIKVQRWGQLMLRHPDSNSWSLSLIVADQSFFLWLKNSRNRSKDVEIISFYCLLFWILFKTTAAPASL